METFFVQFISELLKRAKLTEKDGSVDQEYAQALAAELEKKVGLMVFNELSADNLEKYTKMVQDNVAPSELGNFLTEVIDDFDAKRQKVLDDFAYNFLNRTAKLSQSL